VLLGELKKLATAEERMVAAALKPKKKPKKKSKKK
jgi:hypothetical protein